MNSTVATDDPVSTKVFDAAAWAEWQARHDAAQFRTLPWLATIKKAKMSVSSHAYLRGSVALFEELLAQRELSSLLSARSWIVGDMHVENVGAYRTDHDDVVFDLNDFDGARRGPVVVDVLRLLTSVLLTARGVAFDGVQANTAAQQALRAWVTASQTGRISRPTPSIRRMCKQAERQELGAYLNQRAPKVKGKRRFARGERYRSLNRAWRARAPELLEMYLTALGDRAPRHRVVLADAAQRIAGTGSLGCVRIAYVVTVDEAWRLIELKGTPNAEQTVAATHALVAAPWRGLQALPHAVDGVHFVGRRLEPQQQKLNLAKVPRQELAETFVHIAGLLGRAHRRAADRALPRWSPSALRAVLLHAATLAGEHEAIYLAAHVGD